MKKFVPLLLLVVFFMLILGLLLFGDTMGSKEAAAFAAQIKGKTVQVAATYINDVPNHGQKITMEVTGAYVNVSNEGTVNLTGPLTIDPPEQGCKIAAVTKMGESNIDLSWNCNGVFPTPQSIKGLRLDPDPTGPIPFLWSYSIIPTGATTP